MSDETALEPEAGAGAEGMTEVRARRFTVVDAAGTVRASLGPADDGTTGLLVFDAQHRPRVEMLLDGTGAADVKLHDRDGDVAAWLGVNRTGAPSLYLRGTSRRDAGVRGHAEVCVDEHGCPTLTLHDRNGQARVLLSLDERDGRPTLSLADGLGNSRVVLSEDGDGGMLHVFDHGGQARDGVPRLALGPLPERPAARPAAPMPTPEPPPAAPAPATIDRLARLERAHRRRRLTGPLGLLAAALLGIVGGRFADELDVPRLRDQPAPAAVQVTAPAVPVPSGGRVVEAEEFVLRDPSGGERARFSLLPDGWPFLQMVGPDGTGILQLAVLPGPDVVLRLGAGSTTVALNASSEGPPSISLYEGDRVLFQAPAGIARFPPPSIWP